MDFSIETMQKLEKDQSSVMQQILKSCKVQSVKDVNHALLMKPNKDVLASFVEKLLQLSTNHLELCRTAAVKIDQLKSERIDIQKTVIDIQQKQLQQVQETVKSSVEDTVKTEITLWSDIVNKNSKSAVPSVKTVKKAVRSVFEENERSNNFVIYGKKEVTEEEDEEDVISFVDQLFNEIGTNCPTPLVLDAARIGTVKPQGEEHETRPNCRPIKVTLQSAEMVNLVLSNAKKLKQNPFERWKCLYLSPDRTREERASHKLLVEKVKQKIQDDPSNYHFIRDGQIKSVDKVSLST